MAPPQQQQGQRRPERRAVKIVFYANGVFTGARWASAECCCWLGAQGLPAE